jgi:hypothetical protein
VTERADPFQSVARELLCVLADEGRPLRLRDLEARMAAHQAASQLSVARVAGFVRSAPTPEGRNLEPAYAPTALGMLIARRNGSGAQLAV